MLFKNRLAAFRKSQDGALSVEAIIVLPMLLWAIGAMFVYWDAYKTHNNNVKAAYTLADLISREEDPLDQAYLNGLDQIYDFLIKNTSEKDLRVTVIEYTQVDENAPIVKQFGWSRATGDMQEHASLAPLEDDIPMLNSGDSLIVVETEMFWEPPLSFDLFSPTLDEMTMSYMVYTTPRTAPQVIFTGANPDDSEGGTGDDGSSPAD